MENVPLLVSIETDYHLISVYCFIAIATTNNDNNIRNGVLFIGIQINVVNNITNTSTQIGVNDRIIKWWNTWIKMNNNNHEKQICLIMIIILQ